jgi:hypothetical protein
VEFSSMRIQMVIERFGPLAVSTLSSGCLTIKDGVTEGNRRS